MEPWIVQIIEELRARIAERFLLRELRVFGSSARGDRRTGSDIDVLVCLAEMNRTIEEELFDIAYDLELKYDCLIDLIAVSEEDLIGTSPSAPIYETILTEGIAL
jgi:uncharacterized protein